MLKKISFNTAILLLISSCANMSPDSLGSLGTGWNYTTAGNKDFLYSPLSNQESIFYKSFIFDMEPIKKELRCEGKPNDGMYHFGGYCPYADNGILPTDQDLDRVCKLDDPNSFLYKRTGDITYWSGVQFSCIKNNISEKINYVVKNFSKGAEGNVEALAVIKKISEQEVYRNWQTPIFKNISKTRDIDVNNLNIKSFSLDLPKNSTSNCNDKYEFLWFEGPVNPDTPEIIKRILDDIDICKSSKGKNIPIIITMFSGGGLLADGFRTGNILSEFDTYSIIQEGEYCASSCATAFIGSKKREILGNGQIMFHAPYSFDIAALQKGEIEIECQTKNSKLENYYIQMLGEDDGTLLYDRTMSYCGQNTTWSLNSDAAKIFGITNN